MQYSISPGLLSNRWIYKRLICKDTDANPTPKHRQESVVPLETFFSKVLNLDYGFNKKQTALQKRSFETINSHRN